MGAIIDELRAQIAAERTASELFRDQVRSEVIGQHLNRQWCLEGTQDVLRDLGLAPIPMAYTGTAELTIRVTQVGDAMSEDEARDRIVSALSVVCSDGGITFELGAIRTWITGQPVDGGDAGVDDTASLPGGGGFAADPPF